MSEDQKNAVDAKREQLEAEAKEKNSARSGKGTRLKVGATRGRNPQPIIYENFDQSQPATLPESIQEFMEMTTSEEKTLLEYMIDGYNDAQYTAASDPVAEFVDQSWPEEMQKQFRTVVRNYANATGTSIEDAVSLIKPGIAKAAEAAKAKAQAEAVPVSA